MKTILLSLILLFSTLFLSAQNVGIDVPVPQEKLDVDGNVQSNALILRDDLGNLRMKLDANTGKFQMIDNDTVWYELEVSSPSVERRFLENGDLLEVTSDTLSIRKKYFRYNAGTMSFKLIQEDVVNLSSNKSTMRYTHIYGEDCKKKYIKIISRDGNGFKETEFFLSDTITTTKTTTADGTVCIKTSSNGSGVSATTFKGKVDHGYSETVTDSMTNASIKQSVHPDQCKISTSTDQPKLILERSAGNNSEEITINPGNITKEQNFNGEKYKTVITPFPDIKHETSSSGNKDLRFEFKTELLELKLTSVAPVLDTPFIHFIPSDLMPIRVNGDIGLLDKLILPHPSPSFPSNAEMGWDGNIFNFEVGHPGAIDTTGLAIDPVTGALCIDAAITKINGPLILNGDLVHNSGNIISNGVLIGAAKHFRIDHPLDPINQYLQHSVIESNEMLNTYSGNITTGLDSLATINLPSYFDSLNEDFRYQLTVIGSSFAQAIVFTEVIGNDFVIKTSKPGIKVSWSITGRRKDNFALANPLIVELPK